LKDFCHVKCPAANITPCPGQHIAASYGLHTPDPYACGTSGFDERHLCQNRTAS